MVDARSEFEGQRQHLMKTHADMRGEIADAVYRNQLSTERAKNPKGEVRIAGMLKLNKTMQQVGLDLRGFRRESKNDVNYLMMAIEDNSKWQLDEQKRLRKLLEARYKDDKEARRKQLRADAELRRQAHRHAVHQPGLNSRLMSSPANNPAEAVQGSHEGGGGGGNIIKEFLEIEGAEFFGKKMWKVLRRVFTKNIGKAAVKEAEQVAEKIAVKEVERVAEQVAIETVESVAEVAIADAVGGAVIGILPELVAVAVAGALAAALFSPDDTQLGKEDEAARQKRVASSPALLAKETWEKDHPDQPYVPSVKHPAKPTSITPPPAALTSSLQAPAVNHNMSATQAKLPSPASLTAAITGTPSAAKADSLVGNSFVATLEAMSVASANTMADTTVSTIKSIDKRLHDFDADYKRKNNYVKAPPPVQNPNMPVLFGGANGIAYLESQTHKSGGGSGGPNVNNPANPTGPAPLVRATPSKLNLPPVPGSPAMDVSNLDTGVGSRRKQGGLGKWPTSTRMHANPLAGILPLLQVNPSKRASPQSGEPRKYLTPGPQTPIKANAFLQPTPGFTPASPSTTPSITPPKAPSARYPAGASAAPLAPSSPFGKLGAGPGAIATHSLSPYGLLTPSPYGSLPNSLAPTARSDMFDRSKGAAFAQQPLQLNPSMELAQSAPIDAILPPSLPSLSPFGDLTPSSSGLNRAMPLDMNMSTYNQPALPLAPVTPPPMPPPEVKSPPSAKPAARNKEAAFSPPSIATIPQNTGDLGLHSMQTTDDI